MSSSLFEPNFTPHLDNTGTDLYDSQNPDLDMIGSTNPGSSRSLVDREKETPREESPASNNTFGPNSSSDHSSNSSNRQDLGSQYVSDDVSDEKIGQSIIAIRALVSTKEAGAIIGKSGKNVAELRDETGVKAGVSKPIPGVIDRIMTISGELNSVAKAFSLAADSLLFTVDSLRNTNTNSRQPVTYNNIFNSNHAVLMAPTPGGMATIRLLIPHQQMGSVIGRQGHKIKTIQESTSVRMAASKEMLPQSTERIVEIQGTPESIEVAVWEVGKCLYEDRDRATGSILYNPTVQPPSQSVMPSASSQAQQPLIREPSPHVSPTSIDASGINLSNNSNGTYFNGNNITTNDSTIIINAISPEPDTGDSQNYTIAADMVGCVIGKGGSKIQEIRRTSGAKISIAKDPYNEAGDRLFTITGTPEARQKALTWLYQQLEGERARRSSR